MATPPSLSASFDLNSPALPVLTTTSRSALRPSGISSSRLEPDFPLNRSALAARRTRSAALPKALRVAEPNSTPWPQKTIRTSLPGVEKELKAIFGADDMRYLDFPAQNFRMAQ